MPKNELTFKEVFFHTTLIMLLQGVKFEEKAI